MFGSNLLNAFILSIMNEAACKNQNCHFTAGEESPIFLFKPKIKNEMSSFGFEASGWQKDKPLKIL